MKKLDIRKYSNILVFSMALIPLVLFLYVVWNRLTLPFVFEWGESAGVNQIDRILSGADLYARPNLEFAPLVYTPLYYYLAAGLSSIIGNVLLSARVISFISTIGIVALIGWFIYREVRNALLAWISGMFYLACFALSDGFYDLARVDSLYVLFVLITYYVVLRVKNNSRYILFGVLLAIGFFIKQSFLIVFIPLQIYLLVKHWKISWVMFVSEIIGLVIPLFLINRITESWFFYYIFELPKEHGYSLVSAVNFWIGDTLGPLGILFAFSLIFLLSFEISTDQKNRNSLLSPEDGNKIITRDTRDRWWKYSLFIAGAAGAAWITRSSNGGGANNVMVFYGALALSFGLGADFLLKKNGVKENPWNYALIMLVITVQFMGLIYNPFNYLPAEEEIRSNENLNKRIQETEIPVLIPYRSHISGELDQSPQIHIVNLFELTGYFKGNVQPDGYALVDQIRMKICRQSYGLIVLDQPVSWFDKQLQFSYVQESLIPEEQIQHSDLLDWQRGNERTFTLKSEYDLDLCLESIATNKD